MDAATQRTAPRRLSPCFAAHGPQPLLTGSSVLAASALTWPAAAACGCGWRRWEVEQSAELLVEIGEEKQNLRDDIEDIDVDIEMMRCGAPSMMITRSHTHAPAPPYH